MHFKILSILLFMSTLFLVTVSVRSSEPEQPAEKSVVIKTADLNPAPNPGGCVAMANCRRKTQLDFGGRKMLIKIEKNGVQFDRNLDGKFGSDEGLVRKGSNVDIAVPFKGKTMAYTLKVLYNDCFYTDTCLVGQTEDMYVCLVDKNVNGVFGDIGQDYIYIGPKTGVRYALMLPYTELLPVEGKIMRVKYVDGTLVFKPYDGPVCKVNIDVPDSWSGGKQTKAVIYQLKNAETGFSFNVGTPGSDLDRLTTEAIPGSYTIEKSHAYFKSGSNSKFLYGKGGDREIDVPAYGCTIKGDMNLITAFMACRNADGSVGIQDLWLTSPTLWEHYGPEVYWSRQTVMAAKIVHKGKQIGSSQPIRFG